MVEVPRTDRVCKIFCLFKKIYILCVFVGNIFVCIAVMFPLYIKRRFPFPPFTSSFIQPLLSLLDLLRHSFDHLPHIRKKRWIYMCVYVCVCIYIYIYIYGPGRSVGIATDYGLKGPGSNSGVARFSARPDRPWCPPSFLYNGYRVFLGGKVRLGRDADHSPPSSAAVMEE